MRESRYREGAVSPWHGRLASALLVTVAARGLSPGARSWLVAGVLAVLVVGVTSRLVTVVLA